jgi:hypothetical protein
MEDAAVDREPPSIHALAQVLVSGRGEDLKHTVGQIDAILAVGATPLTARPPVGAAGICSHPELSPVTRLEHGRRAHAAGLCPLLAPGLPGS